MSEVMGYTCFAIGRVKGSNVNLMANAMENNFK